MENNYLEVKIVIDGCDAAAIRVSSESIRFTEINARKILEEIPKIANLEQVLLSALRKKFDNYQAING